MKKDITQRKDIEGLINRFYEKAKTDPQIGHFFTTDKAIDWDKHLPVMYDFWESILFNTGQYSGNPIKVHKTLHQDHPLSKSDFESWLKLFRETVNELFEGPHADQIQQRASSIALIMEGKILRYSGF